MLRLEYTVLALALASATLAVGGPRQAPDNRPLDERARALIGAETSEVIEHLGRPWSGESFGTGYSLHYPVGSSCCALWFFDGTLVKVYLFDDPKGYYCESPVEGPVYPGMRIRDAVATLGPPEEVCAGATYAIFSYPQGLQLHVGHEFVVKVTEDP